MTKTPSQTTLLNRLIGLLFLFIWIPASAAPTFPQLEAEDLNGKAYTLPQALPSRNTLVLIAFKREQQKAVNTWIDGLELKRCKGDYDHLPEAAFYMVGTIEEAIEKADKMAKEAAA